MAVEAALMEIVQVDPRDDAGMEAWHATYFLAESRGRPFAAPYFLAEVRAVAAAPPVATERWLLSGRVDGQVVCTSEVMLPLKDNVNKAELRVHTHPDHRRRGHATAMLDHVEERVVAAGRRLAAAMVDFPYGAGPTGAGDPGVELLLGRGYTLEVGDVQRTLRLPVSGELLDRLAAEAAAHHEGYTLRSWVDRCPDELIGSYGRLLGKLVLEAPSGGLEVEEEVFDVERIREQEATMKAGGRTSLVTVAQDRAGDVVAYTELSVPTDDQGRAYQWGTLVDPGHRGRRLGLSVKVANHRLLQERMRGLTEVLTFNAEVNDHMIAVNEALGFVPTARGGQFQKRSVTAGPQILRSRTQLTEWSPALWSTRFARPGRSDVAGEVGPADGVPDPPGLGHGSASFAARRSRPARWLRLRTGAALESRMPHDVDDLHKPLQRLLQGPPAGVAERHLRGHCGRLARAGVEAQVVHDRTPTVQDRDEAQEGSRAVPACQRHCCGVGGVARGRGAGARLLHGHRLSLLGAGKQNPSARSGSRGVSALS